MLYYKDLSKLFFENYPREADELLFLSGYVGPSPIKQAMELDLKVSIIYGMVKNNFQPQLHDQLIHLSKNEKLNIYYPDSECHSKCYLWLKDNQPIKGFIGSANFSTNGLYTDYRETLLEVDQKQLFFLKSYVDLIKSQSQKCGDLADGSLQKAPQTSAPCTLELFSTKTGQVAKSSGLNWGLGEKAHVNINDAYVAIRVEHIKNYPNLFPPKKALIEERKNANEYIEIIWDDGEIMQALLEQSQEINSIKYPKAISSAPSKAELGKYLRRRIGAKEGELVTTDHLTKYGRNSIEVKKLEEGVYSFDFSI